MKEIWKLFCFSNIYKVPLCLIIENISRVVIFVEGLSERDICFGCLMGCHKGIFGLIVENLIDGLS